MKKYLIYNYVGNSFWGGTFAGKGSTSYGVQFDDAGKPTSAGWSGYCVSAVNGTTGDLGATFAVSILGVLTLPAIGLTLCSKFNKWSIKDISTNRIL